jgi:peptidoglycan/LPS O-acetylase OafA/YrhL
MAAELAGIAPGEAATLLDASRNGVAVFFVISGFVIAWTTRDLGSRLADAGNYSWRRQLRLDPPYYVMIAVVLLSATAERWVPGLEYRAITVGQVLANLFYLQGFTGHEPLLAVAWTLCLEVQFYLVVVMVALLLGCRRRHEAVASPALTRAASRVVFATLGVASFVLPFTGVDPGPWFIGSWWMFFIGMLLAWHHARLISWRTLACALLAVGLWCLAVDLWAAGADPFHGQWAAWATAVVIAALVRTGQTSYRPPRLLLFFGTISYSLYLVHLPVIDTLVAGGYKVLPHTAASAVLLYLVGAALSIGCAVVLNRLVEKPAIRLSARFKRVDGRPSGTLKRHSPQASGTTQLGGDVDRGPTTSAARPLDDVAGA